MPTFDKQKQCAAARFSQHANSCFNWCYSTRFFPSRLLGVYVNSTFIAVAACLLMGCGQSDSNATSKREPSTNNRGNRTMTAAATTDDMKLVTGDNEPSRSTQPPVKRSAMPLPEPEIELPELPFDKAKLKHVQALDQMIGDAQRLDAAAEVFNKMFEELQQEANTSLNGTHQDQLRALMNKVDGFIKFEWAAKPFGQQVSKKFKQKYTSDDEFTKRYRETLSLAKEELDDVIQDNVVRRATAAAMSTTYQYPPRVNVGYIESQLETADQLKHKAIEQVIRSAQTDMTVADYKKGQQLADLLMGTRTKLTLIQQLDSDNESLASTMKQVAEKETSRAKEVQQARAKYRFPARFQGAGQASNPSKLEAAMKQMLAKSGCDVKRISVASRWIAVRSPLGVHLYDQIDFYVATPSKIKSEAKQGVLDVLYITGKTSGPDQNASFVTYSAGKLAQMMQSNL